MNTEIQDLRRVVLRAQRRGGKVVVGGHSLGGTITTAYATWDFNGRAGRARASSGLVFIDGGSRPTPITAERRGADARRRCSTASPWLALRRASPRRSPACSTPAGALGVMLDPERAVDRPELRRCSRRTSSRRCRSTNAGQYGYALDTETSPPALAAAQAHLGHLAASGDPRGWVDDGELTPLERFADMFSGWGLKGLDGTAWYHPLRLTIDAGAVADGNANPAQKVLGVHATHGHDLPRKLRMYAFGAALGGTARARCDARAGAPVPHPGAAA